MLVFNELVALLLDFRVCCKYFESYCKLSFVDNMFCYILRFDQWWMLGLLEILLLQKGEREIERIVNHKAVVAFLPGRHGSPCWHHILHNKKRNTEKSSSENIVSRESFPSHYDILTS